MEKIKAIHELNTRTRLLSNGLAIFLFLMAAIYAGGYLTIIGVAIIVPLIVKTLSIPYDRLDLRNEDRLVLRCKSEDLSNVLMFKDISQVKFYSVDIKIKMNDEKKFYIAYPKNLRKEDLISYFSDQNIETYENGDYGV